jgi:hypothetical protein
MYLAHAFGGTSAVELSTIHSDHSELTQGLWTHFDGMPKSLRAASSAGVQALIDQYCSMLMMISCLLAVVTSTGLAIAQLLDSP